MPSKFRFLAVAVVVFLGVLSYSVAALASHGRASDHAITAGHRAGRACTTGQLGMAFRGVSEPGTDNSALGQVVLWNKSARACALTEPIKVAGLNRAGHRDTNTVSFTIGVKAPKLSPHGTGPSKRGHFPKREVVAQILLIAAGPRPGDAPSCSKHLVDPATWRLELPSGKPMTVANKSASRGPALNGKGGLTTCRGQLGGQSPITIGRT
jgi:hypothetical protein